MGRMAELALEKEQLELPLKDPFEPRQMPRARWPWWTLNSKFSDSAQMLQRPYRVSQLEFVLQHCRKDIDQYISQGFFSKPNRRAMNLLCMTHAYVDLDTYNAPHLKGKSKEEIAATLRIFCDYEDVPEPTLIVYSGRGVYLKWCFADPIPRAAAGRLVALHRALVERFSEFGADPKSVDVSRILRVCGTVNSKSGERAQLLWINESCGEPVTYEFDDLCNEVLPYTLEQIREFRDESRNVSHFKAEKAKREFQQKPSAFNREVWHWGVLEDIRAIVESRWDGTVPLGYIDIVGHLGACQLARVIPAGQLWHELVAWAGIVLPDFYTYGDLQRHSSTLLSRARQAAAGHTVEWHGRRRTPIYTYRKDSLIQMLEITDDEMANLGFLISDSEKVRRRKEKRRADGVQERSEWLQNSLMVQKPWEADGVSRRTWYRRKTGV